jgi:hypothetical protein
MSVIFDMMDANKCHIPHIVCGGKMKGWDVKNRLQSQFLGVIMHGNGSFLYVVDETLPQTADFFGTVLLDIVRTELDRRKAEGIPWPKKFLLQADNASANKNRVVYALGELFARLGVFEEVRYSFLPVGHTHEDIDAMFGALSHVMSRRCVFVYEQLLDVFKRAWPSAKGIIYICVRYYYLCLKISIFSPFSFDLLNFIIICRRS